MIPNRNLLLSVAMPLIFLTAVSTVFGQQTHQYTVASNQPAALVAHAGDDMTSPPGETITLGGNPVASGGTPPYNYVWSPSDDLSDSQLANPEVTPVEHDSTYTYEVIVTDAKGCTAADALLVTIDSDANPNDGTDESDTPGNDPSNPGDGNEDPDEVVTSLSKNQETSIAVYPNPVRGRLTIQTRHEHEIVTVLDNKGNLVLKQSVKRGKHALDTSVLPQGLYLLKFNNGRRIHTVQVLVQQ